ncbi:MAG: hypothetical protein RLZZ387_4126 [Chloroflexota bacterium]|jgi:multiple sugar transport system substrate-binding protein
MATKSHRLLPLLILSLLAACSGQQLPQTIVQTVVVPATVVVEREVVATPSPAPTREGVKVVLRVGTGDSGDGLTPHQRIIEQFEKQNPDIQVQLEPVGSGDYYGRIVNQIEAGNPPDILQIGDDAVPMFVQRGALFPLDDFIHGDEYPLDPSIYLPGVFQPGQWQGRQYLLPKDFSPLAVYYNKKLFDEYGVPYPKEGWTWDDFLRTAQALTRDIDGDAAPDVWGVQLPGPWTSGFEAWVAAAGGRLISDDGSSFVGALDSAETQEAVTFYRDLYGRHRVAPPPVDIAAFGGGNTEFEEGRAAMRVFGRWPQGGLRQNPGVELGVVGMPAGRERASVLFWGGFGISSQSRNPDAAWRFLRFYVGAEGAQVWKDWGLPTVTSVAEESGQVDDPIEGVWLGELEHLAPRAYVATPFWGSTADPLLRGVLERAIREPDLNVAAALRDAAREAQRALDDQR